MSILTIWKPVYRLDGVIKAITALASILTAFALSRLIPVLQNIPTASQLRNSTMALEARQERGRLQDKFLSHVSHELRTPLTAIYFFTSNVLDGLCGDLTSEQREHLTLALDNVQQLKSMVSDLLDITRVETHKLTLEPAHISPNKIIAEVLATCRTNAAAKNISLDCDVAMDLPFIWADPVRVRQIFVNLIDNGIKFSPERGTVTVRSQRSDSDDRFLYLSVSDTGCGISPADCGEVFERLAQVKSTAEASRAGLGLGLFISRDLVSRHGGRIWVESRLGHGSTFYFTLPIYSLAKLCARVFTPPNLEEGTVTLIAVDVSAVDGGLHTSILLEIERLLQRCIHAYKDVLLPAMSDAGPVATFFIVACGSAGADVLASRIARELQSFDNVAQLKPKISKTTVVVALDHTRDWQVSEATAKLERLVQGHVTGEELLK